MKANELMIGDWIKPKNVDSYFKVGLIDSDSIWNDTVTEVWDLDEIEPIPLTAEILEKNGWKPEFDKRDYMVKYDLAVEGKNCWMMWAIKEHNLDIQRQDEKLDMYNLKVQRVCMPCDFVHQLQDAIRLCGIKKEIEL